METILQIAKADDQLLSKATGGFDAMSVAESIVDPIGLNRVIIDQTVGAASQNLLTSASQFASTSATLQQRKALLERLQSLTPDQRQAVRERLAQG